MLFCNRDWPVLKSQTRGFTTKQETIAEPCAPKDLKFGQFQFYTRRGHVWYEVVVTGGGYIGGHEVSATLGKKPRMVGDVEIATTVTKAAGRAWCKLLLAKIAEPSFLWEPKKVTK